MRKFGRFAVAVNGAALVGYGLAELDRSIHNPHEMPNDSPYVTALGTTATGSLSDVPYVRVPDTILGGEYALPATPEAKMRAFIDRRSYKGFWVIKT
jgi:hypothetical protein